MTWSDLVYAKGIFPVNIYGKEKLSVVTLKLRIDRMAH